MISTDAFRYHPRVYGMGGALRKAAPKRDGERTLLPGEVTGSEKMYTI